MAPHLGGDGLAAQAALADLLLQRRNGRIVVGNVVFKHRDAGIRPGDLLRYGPYFRVAAVGFGDQMLDLRAGALGLGVNGLDLPPGAGIVRARDLNFALLLAHRVPRFLHGVHPERYLQALAALGQLQILLCLFALPLQRAHALLQLAQDIPQAHQIFLGGGQAALGLIFAVAVFGDAGRFLKNFPALV